MSKLHQNVYINQILYRIRSIKQTIFNNYATNLKTTISQRKPEKLVFAPVIISWFWFCIFNRHNWYYYYITTTPTNGSACRCHVSPSILWQVNCTVIGGSSSYVIRTYKNIFNSVQSVKFEKKKIRTIHTIRAILGF